MNPVTHRNYSDSTPNVSYTYKTTAPAIGSLTKVESSVSTTEYTGFDILGRVTGHKQTTDGQDYTTSYVYDLSGGLFEQTYPSGRKVKNVTDQNGYLSMVQSAKCMDASPVTNATCTSQAGLSNYASSFSYNAVGAVTSMQLGNGKWESTQFNSRLQPTQIALGTTPGATNFLKLNYSYGTANNNGNVQSQTITVPTVGVNPGFVAVQNYNYDQLNRLEVAEETVASNQTWKQAFTYDRYGNRNFDEAETTTLLKYCTESSLPVVCAADRKVFNPTVNPSDNRLSSADGYVFDDVGNTTSDPQGRTFIYDAENKQVEVKDDLNQTVGNYWYDGDGKRIKKYVPTTGETTVFIYDAAGKLIADYSTELTPDPKVSYTTADHLGSPRILTDEDGEIISRRDFHPFGEEISTIERTSSLGYQSDDIRQKFTTYERDSETDLDFAQARIYSSKLGRFSSPDVFLNDTTKNNPSSWNLYLYVRNNPLKYTDKTGEVIDGTNLTTEERDLIIEDFKKKTGYKNLYFDSNGILVIGNDGAFQGGSRKARELLSQAVATEHLFFLMNDNDSTRTAFGRREDAIFNRNGNTVTGSAVYIDFLDFNRIMNRDSDMKDTFSVGMVLFHELAHGLFPHLRDGNSMTFPGEIEFFWINVIRAELSLPERVSYPAKDLGFYSQAQFVEYRDLIGPELRSKHFKDMPLEPVPVSRVLNWQNSVGGLR